jgi:oligopeptide/dipeptide ABC transporter ATP-binding protein
VSAQPQAVAAGSCTGTASSVLSVRGLHVSLETAERRIEPVAGLTFDVARGRTLAVVGESGSGKSMTAASIVRLLPEGAAITSGEILLGDRDIVLLSEAQLREIRGTGVALMPQNPMTALNPSRTIGYQVDEPLLVHAKVSKREATDRVLDMLRRTGITDPRLLDAYPHQLSGGMRQRVVLAMALVAQPTLLIADEPTTALDVTTQEQIVDLLAELQEELGLSIILITHDLGVVARIAHDVLVMYAGKQLEYGKADDVFAAPGHPYTRGLIDSVDFDAYAPGERLRSIGGAPPQLDVLPSGCVFRTRCAHAADVCADAVPLLQTTASFARHPVACHLLHAGELPPWSRRTRS